MCLFSGTTLWFGSGVKEDADVPRTERTLYFNDARHYYMYVVEPPMTIREAWRPIDEIATTGVDTFVYGVERNDGLFYPSRHGIMFGDDMDEMTSGFCWRAWRNLHSLIDQGHDPLRVLIDRAHDKGLDFIASLRFAGYAGIEDGHRIPLPDPGILGGRFDPAAVIRKGADHAHREVRDHCFAVLEELATDYPTDGVELDFIFTSFSFEYGKGRESLSIMTELVGRISEMVRSRPGNPGVVGARVLPTEAMCLAAGLDVRRWLQEGFLDYVVPMIYQPLYVDGDMPIEWLVEAAHDADTSVYGFLHPYYHIEDDRRFHNIVHATPEMVRAAAANHRDKGVDGLYAWFLKWPFGDAGRALLAELGDPESSYGKAKHYFIPWRDEMTAALGYDRPLPQPIPVGGSAAIPLYISDDFSADDGRARVVLRINLANVVTADNVTLALNGNPLALENAVRSYGGIVAPYESQWLEIELDRVRPRRGRNTLEVALRSRPEHLYGGITVVDLEVVVDFGDLRQA